MKFTDLFIRRPVLALVVSLVIIVAGLQAIRSLNVRQYPRSENSSITVTTSWPSTTSRRAGLDGSTSALEATRSR